MSGTHRGAQLYFQNDGITPLVVPYNALMTMVAGVQTIGQFFAANGANLATAGNWSGILAADIAVNMAGTIAHTNNMDFAKLTFALLQGWTNTLARLITLKIQVEKSGELSQNSGNILQMPIELSAGTLFGAEDFQILDDVFVMPQWINSTPSDQGLVWLQTDTTWTKNTLRTQLAADRGVNGRIIDYSPSPTGKALIFAGWTGATSAFISLSIINIDSYDVDGFPNWGTPTDIDGEGSSGIAAALPYDHPNLVLNDMPLMMSGRNPQAAGTGDILVNQGTLAAPAYTGFIAMTAINARLVGAKHIRFDSSNRAYFAHRVPSGGGAGAGVARLTFTGTNNNETSLLTPGNWTYEEIGWKTGALSPATSGNGQTAQYDLKGMAIDETDIVNGEPTLYATDEFQHVIFRIQANTTNPTSGIDWDFTIIVGAAGVSGNTEGIGTAARLNRPAGLNIYNGDLYCLEKIGAKVRKITLPGLQTSTFFGIDTVRSHTNQFSF